MNNMTPENRLSVVFFTPDIADNSLGRTYCLWLLAQSLGWNVAVVSTKGDRVWPPLADTPISDDCFVLREEDLATHDLLREADLFIAVKPLTDSFGVAERLSHRLDKPLLLDIDDPDLEAQLSWARPLRRAAKGVLRRSRIQEIKRLVRRTRSVPHIVSNPVLQARYGGPIIPHIRVDPGRGALHVSRTPSIAFVGSNRPHKGVDLLRAAVERVQDLGYTLTVTDTAPADARSWETWTGSTSIEGGLSIVSGADIVVIPSLDVPFAHGQLPAKLMDAMFMGRAIVVSSIEPMPWALAGTGLTIQPGSVQAIESALRELADPDLRSNLGNSAREHAIRTFGRSPSDATLDKCAQAAIDDYQHIKLRRPAG